MNNRTERPHGIMFHHFYNEKHGKGQGSISAIQIEKIIEHYGDKLLTARDWFTRALANSLDENDICLTFDDALLCQYEIALPVLNKYNLTAFWFVYSSVLNGGIEKLEVYRKYRTVYFASVDEFYEKFFSVVGQSPYHSLVQELLRNHSHDKWRHFPFYSRTDTEFRFVRDEVLGVDKYNCIMDMMMKNHGVNLIEFASDLWMKTEHIQNLHSQGHIIGLHSHTHPTTLAKLPLLEQKKEYRLNYKFFQDVLGEKPITVAHPCNSYSDQTLTILHDLGIKLGFRANMEDHNYSFLEFPREDHINVIRRIER